jgi:hypothetical protein
MSATRGSLFVIAWFFSFSLAISSSVSLMIDHKLTVAEWYGHTAVLVTVFAIGLATSVRCQI